MTLGRIVSFLILAAVIVAGLQYMGMINVTGGAGPAAPPKPPGPVDYYKTGEDDFMAGKYPEALEAYTKATLEHPLDDRRADAMFRIGRCWDEQKNERKALAAYQDYVKKFPQGGNVKKATERIEYLSASLGIR